VRRRGGFEGKCYFRKVMPLCFNSSSSLPLPPLASLSSRSTYPESFQSMCKLFLRCFGPLFSQKKMDKYTILFPFFFSSIFISKELFHLSRTCSLLSPLAMRVSASNFSRVSPSPVVLLSFSASRVCVCLLLCSLLFLGWQGKSKFKKTHSSCRSGVHLVASAVAFVTLPSLSVKRAYLVWSVPFLLV